jgi:hypothetical protein
MDTFKVSVLVTFFRARMCMCKRQMTRQAMPQQKRRNSTAATEASQQHCRNRSVATALPQQKRRNSTAATEASQQHCRNRSVATALPQQKRRNSTAATEASQQHCRSTRHSSYRYTKTHTVRPAAQVGACYVYVNSHAYIRLGTYMQTLTRAWQRQPRPL